MLAALAPYRLGPQRLVGEPLPDPVAVVGHLGAVQSQDHLTARWSVARRCGGDDAAVAAALDDGRILRTHVLRTTWHHVLPADLPDLVAVTGPRVLRLIEQHVRPLGIEPDALHAAATTAAHWVRAHDACTREEVATGLAEAGIHVPHEALAHVVMAAEVRGLVAGGPVRGRRQTYRALDLPPSTRSEDDLLARIARTYARGHGPFTPADLAWWTSLTLTTARRAVALAGLAEVELAGRRLVTDVEPHAVPVPRALLLANYDETISHVRDPGVLAEIAGSWAALTRGLGLLLVDGRLVGGWTRTVRAAHVAVTVTSHVTLDRGTRAAVEVEAQRFAESLGLPVRLVLDAP